MDGEFQTFARNCLGALASIAEISTLKRLVFESHTMLLAQLREQVSNPQAGASPPLPAMEREAKLRDLRTRLGGVVIEQQSEPSHHLIDLFSQQWEAKQLEYISLKNAQVVSGKSRVESQTNSFHWTMRSCSSRRRSQFLISQLHHQSC